MMPPAPTGPTMRWVELWAEVAPDLADELADAFIEAGASGAAFSGPSLMREAAARGGEGGIGGLMFPEMLPPEGPMRVTAYIALDDAADIECRVEAVRRHIASPPFREGTELHVSQVDPVDWSQSWRQHYRVEHVGQRIVIAPSWLDYTPEPHELVVRLDPGQAFGTGQHETTRLAARALEACVTPGCRVLDVGTGSGVLAIAAARLGAASVEAIDIDPVAVETAEANVAENSVGDVIAVRRGDLTSGVNGRFDVVVANILADVVIELAPEVPRLLAPGGRFISSGYVHKSVHRVASALESIGHAVIAHLTEGEWDALVSAPALEGGGGSR